MNKIKDIFKYFLRIYCAISGKHTYFITSFFGYQYCGRCGSQIGDTLGGVGIGYEIGIDEHHPKNCKSCNKIRKSWVGVDRMIKPLEERVLRWVNN